MFGFMGIELLCKPPGDNPNIKRPSLVVYFFSDLCKNKYSYYFTLEKRKNSVFYYYLSR